ncbi:MAG: hypothetical protein HY238_21000 [Acidobacteria bacterium]|nr:hypothetical protein [Acidobacteriota bacterium]
MDDEFDVCWNCQTPRGEAQPEAANNPEQQASPTAEDQEDQEYEEWEDIPYRFRTLLGHGKLISGFGWAAVAFGALLGLPGLFTFLGDRSDRAVGGLLMIGGTILGVYGLGMVIAGQMISCFVSIERNTRVTFEVISQLSGNLLRLKDRPRR